MYRPPRRRTSCEGRPSAGNGEDFPLQSDHDAREGAYLLRTNLTAETAEELWSKYMQLTETEASFS
jgi:hypothetical protein